MSESQTPEQNATGGPSGGAPAGAAKTVEQRLAEAEVQIGEQKEAWLRAKAEADNARKRAQADVASARRFAVERFAEGLLPVADSLEAALAAAGGAPQALRDGVELTLRQLKSAFQKAGVSDIAPAVGERFDPNLHQAMAAVDSPAEPNTIVAVMVKGYSLHDRVLRPALVTVAKALENQAASPNSDGNPATH